MKYCRACLFHIHIHGKRKNSLKANRCDLWPVLWLVSVVTVSDWQGTVTKILNAEAGLYEIDGQVGLCLAYQPAQKWGGGLRPGAEIQVSVMSSQNSVADSLFLWIRHCFKGFKQNSGADHQNVSLLFVLSFTMFTSCTALPRLLRVWFCARVCAPACRSPLSAAWVQRWRCRGHTGRCSASCWRRIWARRSISGSATVRTPSLRGEGRKHNKGLML